jgi:hypothetical protein
VARRQRNGLIATCREEEIGADQQRVGAIANGVRALNLRPSLYTKLLDHFHSSGIELDRLSALWARAVLGLFPSPVRINGRLVLVGDGIKAPKRGKKMPR